MTLPRNVSAGNGAERELRDALARFATGVAIVTTRAPDGRYRGVTANSFASVSLDPPLVLWSLRRNAPSLRSFADSGHFAVNVLSADQVGLSRHFARPHEDKFSGVAFVPGFGGCPVIEGALAVFECEAAQQMDGGDHLMFLGRLLRASHRHGEPLIFSAGRYCIPSPLIEAEPAPIGDWIVGTK
jgi:flavin reductase (DIM6/NTAB) family NADH-FMN oxidoreductase RutF